MAGGGVPVGVPGRGQGASVLPAPGSACVAPAVQLWFGPDGDVRSCCRILTTLGSVREQRLPDIWAGAGRAVLQRRLDAHDYGGGCENCGAEVALEGRPGSYPANFDERGAHLGADPATAAWPRWMEFNLSNACNLQCIQCDGDLSSAIRAHREHRPPLTPAYDDTFFDDLVPFLPHLDHAGFAGGEPFLAEESRRVWSLIGSHAPDLPCTVITNATRWGRREREALGDLRVGFVFSLDGITPATYEAIRVGADLDAVLENVRSMAAFARSRGMPVQVNHCLMVQNHEEFADLLLFAERMDAVVNVSVVRQPVACSLARLPRAELAAVLAAMEERDPHVRPRLHRNERTWATELARIRSWVAGKGEVADEARWGRTIIDFRCVGAGAHDDNEARQELETLGTGVHTLVVGPDDRVRAASPSLADLLGGATPSPVGRAAQDLPEIMGTGVGPLRRYQVTARTEDRVDATAVYGDRTFLVRLVAVRGADGTATEARILVAEVPHPAT